METVQSIYLHIPFCQKRCSYCDFNTFSGMNHLIPVYLKNLIKETTYYGKYFDHKTEIKTIFFGGGTPSLISVDQFQEIFNALHNYFDVSENAEISLEANPGTVSLDYLRGIREVGFNRISFGLQTSNPQQLRLLGRIHDHYESIQAIKHAKMAGFSNINLDLIYGLPGQTLEDWKKNLEDCLSLGTEHFSLYALGIEEKTPLFDWVKKGLVQNPDPDLAAEMYELADQYLTKSGYECYEISNYYKLDRKTDYRCLHNLQYWKNKYYIGIGAGAHGYLHNFRYENIGGIGEYITRMRKAGASGSQFSAVLYKQEVSRFQQMQEMFMLGLRLVNEGVSIREFSDIFNESPLEIFKNELNYLMKNNLIQIDNDDAIHITKDARLLGNVVFRQFVD